MIVILDNIRSALNVGSILRTAEGLGILEVYLCGLTPGIENKKVQKTALGAEKNLKTLQFASTADAVDFCISKQIPIYALEITKDSKDIRKVKVGGKFALVVGNEVSGVSPIALKNAKEVLEIPMKGKKESLNVTNAFAIAAFKLLEKTL